MTDRVEDIIIQTVCRILTPFIQLYALYVILHGHYGPGGGFQGGVILGASFILLVISYDIKETKRRMSEKLNTIFSSLGLILYSGIGVLCLIFGGTYLDYGKLPLSATLAESRSLGILGIEIGVGIAVMAVMFSIFMDICSGGEHKNGNYPTNN
jgi:multicomponent Na+:H+ antiporter subunit B